MSMDMTEKIFLEELEEPSHRLKRATKGLSIGALIRLLRKQLGMSQAVLAQRSGMPQSTVSRIEREVHDPNLSTLQKVLHALSCDLVLAPLLHNSVDDILYAQAEKRAQERIDYLKGTMSLEDQLPDERFLSTMLKEETNSLLHGSRKKLWEK